MADSRNSQIPVPPAQIRKTSLRDIAFLFLKLGTIGFGGPAAHIALMEEEVVRRRGWLSRQEFLDLLGATNLIPGPNSTELAIHVGHRQAGWAGLVVAGVSFILPAVLIVSGLAWTYVRYGTLPQFAGILYGVKPVVMAIILQALWRLGRAALKTRFLGLLTVAGMTASFLGIHELILLALSGAAVAAEQGTLWFKNRGLRSIHLGFPLPLFSSGTAAGGMILLTTFSLWSLFFFFLKVGSVLFGSGYVLLVFLRSDLVERWHWLSETQLLDAVAIGQVTPGPVFTTATFIGYVLGGAGGATLATVGIFLPAFLFVAASGPLVPRIRQSAVAGAFLDGVNAASLALMAVVTWEFARVTLADPLSVFVLVAALLLLIHFHVNSSLLIGGAALVGLLTHGFGYH